MKLAVIPGDGIGPEVIAEAVKVLDAVLPGVEKTEYDLGAKRFHATGEVLPESVVPELRTHDAILWVLLVIRQCPVACSSEVCCCVCVSSWTTTSTCDRVGSIRV